MLQATKPQFTAKQQVTEPIRLIWVTEPIRSIWGAESPGGVPGVSSVGRDCVDYLIGQGVAILTPWILTTPFLVDVAPLSFQRLSILRRRRYRS